MATEAVVERRSVGRRLADFFHGRPRLQVGTLWQGRSAGWSSATSARSPSC
jgi:hypothetical protein